MLCYIQIQAQFFTIDDEVLPGLPLSSTFDIGSLRGSSGPFENCRPSIVIGGHIDKNVFNVLGSRLIAVPDLPASFAIEQAMDFLNQSCRQKFLFSFSGVNLRWSQLAQIAMSNIHRR